MQEMIEIRWHGRGGQGVVTAARLLAEAAMEAGYFIQAFPDYGPERSGAPIRAFTRLSRSPISIHSQVQTPDMVIVLDDTLLGSPLLLEGLKSEGWLVVNSARSPEQVRRQAGGYNGRLALLDATRIALEVLKRNLPNTPLLGALVRLTGLFSLEDLTRHIRHHLAAKFGEEVVRSNLEAVRRGFEEVWIDPGRIASGERPIEAVQSGMALPWFELPRGGLILDAGNAIAYRTGDWRTFRPVVEMEKCTHCLYCWLYCPDDAIQVRGGRFLGFDEAHCKGCGICAAVCPPKAITMVEESRAVAAA
ncbi:2-oxoacid:acceptor oxidoreductase family protein [Thermoflexus sp.]|uniref:2-oxoacid:acceptor oxidoreductase family protein n=1 Tax=Thermoflexus sp. TaxID=1969742 RepID=UPI0025FA9A7C|nr:2-oxoacid:acceptor oxidoreductase family protein [Thermoflexus sp.]MDW8181126.1 2-oxoacid:acceptor oxidoreductase family protein [Anaerolineae bacterium]MCS6964888.1 2-oxoacid:acceptor oxidoreductase family protein [Thermoflexus sp.]MCS7351668.1 2-oxoacid:acceptor oxidoreductase family protein [Thermoflexus sp.]MCX7691573.1 2-oxoacid:acceptor oxidoreductase family protein [Thermoflexus sp.]MDW8184352.1 2-oxoacid:acceptor oxidoreductase family protein [Anaerolineae bacterium]